MQPPQLHLGFRTNLPQLDWPLGVVAASTQLSLLLPHRRVGVTVALDPAVATLRATTAPNIWHYYRWADATLRPQPASPPLFQMARGDCYLAVAPAPLFITDSAAIARYVHLRDYFNAHKLAEGIWEQLLELADGRPLPELAVLVVEAR